MKPKYDNSTGLKKFEGSFDALIQKVISCLQLLHRCCHSRTNFHLTKAKRINPRTHQSRRDCKKTYLILGLINS